MRLSQAWIFFIVALTLNTALADDVDIEQNFSVQSGGTLYLKTDAGSVEIESHDRDTVDVRVEATGSGAEDFKVEMRQDGDDVRIVGEKEGMSWGWRLKAVFTIKVPKNYNLDLSTGGGSIEVEDLIGEVEASTSGGSIKLGAIDGDVDVQTSGGSIRVADVAGNIRAHTSGGSIKATISQQPTEDCRLTTSGGSVTAYLADGIAVDLSASTSGGRVKSDFEVDGRVRKNNIRGEINGGGPELQLRTSGGSVNVRKL